MKVSGKMTMKTTPWAASGDRTTLPRNMPTHSIVKASNASSPNPARACATSVWMRQPTTRPASVITVRPSRAAANSASTWPTRKAERAIGSERKRSSTPSPRSVAMDIAGPMTPKVRV
jgi:hypothetical protein